MILSVTCNDFLVTDNLHKQPMMLLLDHYIIFCSQRSLVVHGSHIENIVASSRKSLLQQIIFMEPTTELIP